MSEIKSRRRVVIESPYKADNFTLFKRNICYAVLACRDSLLNYNEAPFASHLLYTFPLEDSIQAERAIGMNAGLDYVQDTDATIVYEDLGLSSGMLYGIDRAESVGRPVEFRKLPETLMDQVHIVGSGDYVPHFWPARRAVALAAALFLKQ